MHKSKTLANTDEFFCVYTKNSNKGKSVKYVSLKDFQIETKKDNCVAVFKTKGYRLLIEVKSELDKYAA